MATRVSARLTPAAGRRFGLEVGAAFLVLAALLAWRGGERAAGVLAAVGAALVLAGWVMPTRLSGVHAAWMRLALMLSTVTTPLFMGVVYFLVITPTGLVRRALGDRPLDRSPADGSYFVPRGEARRSDLERQF